MANNSRFKCAPLRCFHPNRFPTWCNFNIRFSVIKSTNRTSKFRTEFKIILRDVTPPVSFPFYPRLFQLAASKARLLTRSNLKADLLARSGLKIRLHFRRILSSRLPKLGRRHAIQSHPEGVIRSLKPSKVFFSIQLRGVCISIFTFPPLSAGDSREWRVTIQNTTKRFPLPVFVVYMFAFPRSHGKCKEE